MSTFLGCSTPWLVFEVRYSGPRFVFQLLPVVVCPPGCWRTHSRLGGPFVVVSFRKGLVDSF